MDFYLYTSIIRIGTQFNIIRTIISNIGFMINHTGPYIHLNLKKYNQCLYDTDIYKCQFLSYDVMPI